MLEPTKRLPASHVLGVYVEKILLKLAKQLMAYDEASLASLWAARNTPRP